MCPEQSASEPKLRSVRLPDADSGSTFVLAALSTEAANRCQ